MIPCHSVWCLWTKWHWDSSQYFGFSCVIVIVLPLPDTFHSFTIGTIYNCSTGVLCVVLRTYEIFQCISEKELKVENLLQGRCNIQFHILNPLSYFDPRHLFHNVSVIEIATHICRTEKKCIKQAQSNLLLAQVCTVRLPRLCPHPFFHYTEHHYSLSQGILLSTATGSSQIHFESKPCCSSLMIMFYLVKMHNADHGSRNGMINRPCTHNEVVCSLLLTLIHND